MNTISIMGRITADLKCEYTTNGHAVLHFNVAVPRPHTKDTTDFIRCVAWRNTAEFVEKYFCKGKMIALTGMITSRSWKDDNNNKHTVVEVMVDNVEFCGDKQNSKQDKQPQPQQQLEQTTINDIPDSFQASDQDIPF